MNQPSRAQEAPDIEVRIGETHLIVKRKGTSYPTVARILGEEPAADGSTRLWLDRLVHRTGEDRLGPCLARGVYVTELVIPPEAATARGGQ